MPRFGLSVACCRYDDRSTTYLDEKTPVLQLIAVARAACRVPSTVSIFGKLDLKLCQREIVYSQIKTSSSNKMTIFEYHSRMETGMKKITCSGNPHEV